MSKLKFFVKTVLGHTLTPMVVHHSFMFLVVSLCFLTDFLPNQSGLLLFPYFLVTILSVYLSRLALQRDPASMGPLYISFSHFAMLVLVTMEKRGYFALLWFALLLLVNLRKRNTITALVTHTLYPFLLAVVTYSAVVYLSSYFTNNPTEFSLSSELVALSVLALISFLFCIVEVNSLIAKRKEDKEKVALLRSPKPKTRKPSGQLSTEKTKKGSPKREELRVVASSPESDTEEGEGLEEDLTPDHSPAASLAPSVDDKKSLSLKQAPLTSTLKNPKIEVAKGQGKLKRAATSPSSGVNRWEVPYSELKFDQLLGKGASGSVFRGTLSGEEVAIKKLICDGSLLEAELLSQLSHRHIISFRGMCTEDSNLCIVMEYAPKGTLGQILRDQSYHVGLDKVVSWASQIASGMDYLHTGAPKQIIHRDLKSGNILVSETDNLKITDFGLSRELNQTAQMSTVGTFSWMAPEVIRNEPYSEKADVWSFGVVLWELLTRRVPFEGMEPLAVAYHIGTGNLKLPTNLQGVPPLLKQLLEQCWETKPKNRPSFKEILRILESSQASSISMITNDWFTEKQGLWKAEIQESFSQSESLIKKQALMLSQVEQSDAFNLLSNEATAASKERSQLSRILGQKTRSQMSKSAWQVTKTL